MLWWVMFWGAVILFTLVLALLVLSIWRPAWISAVTPRQWIIGGGLVLPIPILIALLASALVLGESLLPREDRTAPLQVYAHASQWQWQFAYPGTEMESEALHLPAGEPVDIVVTAGDVIHSFWVPRLGGKIDAIPGHTNVIRLQADEPGIYRGICAEYCGSGHESMGFVVEAHAPAAFYAMIGAGQ